MEKRQTIIVKAGLCSECGNTFVVTLDEYLHKRNRGMEMPKRCKACRRERRLHPDPYEGIYSTFYSYPPTRGHRHKVHGGV